MRIYHRPDWPPGSNAALLERQVRTPFGFTWRARRPSALPWPGRRAEATEALRSTEPQPNSVVSVTTPPGKIAGSLLALLHALADADAVLPSSEVLADRVGAGIFRTSRISNLLEQLEERGLVRRHTRHSRREIELIARGVLLSPDAPPRPLGEPVLAQAA